ncbi:hypothetical protein LNQ52_29835 [Klebsiella pneumoniae subsp. pneumoniae]|nr:hypothetical protein [Klebsiella pneumoniae subsp. pneumoniae]
MPTISELESDTAARHALLLKSWQKQCQEKKAQAKGWRFVAGRRDGLATAGGGLLAGQKRCSGGWPAGLTAG